MSTQVVADPWEEARPKRLSPSRAGDFMQCPKMYAAKVVEQIPDPPTVAQARGVLVHQVLEDVYSWPVPSRTLANAQVHLSRAWRQVTSPEEGRGYLDHMHQWGYTEQQLFDESAALLEVYWTLEDPMALPEGSTAQESKVEGDVSGVPVIGFIDRTDTAPGGQVRIVDLKTGKHPLPGYEDKALWQLRFYAWVWWRLHGVLPTQVRLVYMGGRPGILEDSPTPEAIERFEEEAIDLWRQIQSSYDRNDWPTRPSKLCGWCPLRATCPDAQ